jgi:MFS family permease
VTFLVSAALVFSIPERKLRSQESLTRGHWRDVSDGIRLVFMSAPLRTVLVVWNVVLIGSALINVAEVFFAQDVLRAGDVGFGVIVAASGVGLALGSFLAAPSLGKVGLRRHYAGSILLMGVGWGGAALTSEIWVAVPLVVAGALGNGAAIVANQILVQRGAPDRYRGRALATIMSSNYAILGLATAAAGFAVEVWGARAVWLAAGAVYLFGVLVTLAMTRWLPVSATDSDPMLDELGAAAASVLERDGGAPLEPEPGLVTGAALRPEPVPDLLPPPEPRYGAQPGRDPSPQPTLVAANGSSRDSLGRLADLFEEIEERREAESRRSRS